MDLVRWVITGIGATVVLVHPVSAQDQNSLVYFGATTNQEVDQGSYKQIRGVFAAQEELADRRGKPSPSTKNALAPFAVQPNTESGGGLLGGIMGTVGMSEQVREAMSAPSFKKALTDVMKASSGLDKSAGKPSQRSQDNDMSKAVRELQKALPIAPKF